MLAIFVGAAAISACQNLSGDSAAEPGSAPSSELTDCRTVQHEMGETEICGQPQQIVAIGPVALETSLALDIQPVGFADHFPIHKGNYDKPSQQIPYVGDLITSPISNVGLSNSPSPEAILKLQPELILAERLDPGQYNTLSEIAPTLPLELAESEANLVAVARAVGLTEQAKQTLNETEQNIASARRDFEPFVKNNPKVLLLSAFDLQTMFLGNSAHGTCRSIVEEIGFQLVALPGFDNSDADLQVPISLEALPELNEADLVIMLGANFNPPEQPKDIESFEDYQLADIKKSWQENAIAQSLNASQAGRVYFIPAYVCLGLPGPIGTELYLEELKQQLLPDAP
ncbi:MAG: iron-siderophore ABC transporter substrate-binding protein [Cyanobacteria bacterium P01_G01_bin.38]